MAEDLLAYRFAQGDESALRAAYDEHKSLVYSMARRALGDDRSLDVTQEVFIAAWKARERFDPSRGSLPGWLVGIAKNKIVDEIRRSVRRVPTDSSPDAVDRLADSESDDRSWIDNMADQMLIAKALETLSDRARTVIELHFFNDLTQQQIADKTGLPLGTVKSDIRRGLQTLRHHMEQEING